MSAGEVFDTQIEGDTLILITLGDVGYPAEDQIAAQSPGVLEQFERSKLKNVVVDLEGTSYFGPRMLELMVAMWKRVRAARGKMAVCNASPTCHEVLVKVDPHPLPWPICSSRKEALETVSG